MDITISGDQVQVGKKWLPGKNGVSNFCRVVANNCLSGMREEPIPDNVRWIVERGEITVYVLELPPELRLLLWGDEGRQEPDDDYEEGGWEVAIGEATQRYSVATPYVVMVVPFYQNKLHGNIKAHYRNQPLKSLDDPLFKTNLLNIHDLVCIDPGITGEEKTHEEILRKILDNLWNGEFNGDMRSSDWHNFLEETSDSRLTSIEAWQKASQKDPNFVLDVEWIPYNYTLRQVVMSHFNAASPCNAKTIGNLMLKAS